MNERPTHDLRQEQPGFSLDEIHRGFAKYQPVHGRFNLTANNPQSIDVIDKAEDDSRHRYLVVPTDPLSEQIDELLQESNVHLLENLDKDGNLKVYRVAIQAKPLINEKLFPEHESTDTYISDRELFHGLGSLWRAIYDATSHIPTENLLSKTGMLEFTKGESQLFPIPPFTDWSSFQSSEEALKCFEEQVQTQLQDAYPSISTRDLSDAAREGFTKE